MNFNKFTNIELIDYLAKYNVTDEDIKGSGKKGRVLKADYIRAAKKVYKEYPQITVSEDVVTKATKMNKSGKKVTKIKLELPSEVELPVEKVTKIKLELPPVKNDNLVDDVKMNILLNVNIDNLLNICLVDQSYYKICLDPYFWRLYFHQYQLPFPDELPKEFVGKEIPTTLRGWIDQFIAEYLFFIYYGREIDPNWYQLQYTLLGLFFLKYYPADSIVEKYHKNTAVSLVTIKLNLKNRGVSPIVIKEIIKNMDKEGFIRIKNSFELSPQYKKRLEKIRDFLVQNNGKEF